MTRTSAISISLAIAFLPTAAIAAPPDFSPTPETQWYAYSEVLLPPPSGPGPVLQDPEHPLITNDDFRATGKQPTYPMGDPRSPILKPWAADVLRKVNADTLAGKPIITQHAQCLPGGVTQFLVQPSTRPMYIVQGKDDVVMINESFAEVRHIYLTGGHHSDPGRSWWGDSIGHYEGDTLVVDTNGFNDKTHIDRFHTPHTAQLHTLERFRLIDGGKEMQVDLHVEDTGAFTTPWNAVMRYRKYELVATNAQKSGAKIAVLATPDEGPLIEAVCDGRNALQFVPGATLAEAKTPDF
ncbi:MAG TPA: hypothetical protein VFW28_04345 [Micropepsaceae bacterium]|nr:hypothetical protein [Micropepsaceae bacterium]